MKTLTHRQEQVLYFMRAFFAKNDQLPPCQYVRMAFGWKSDNAAQTHIAQLERRGYLERNETGKYRFTRLPASGGRPC